MARSSLLGTDTAAAEPARRGDTGVLGPGDSSDSGSDLMGVADSDESDPNLPTDVAMDDAHARPMPHEVADGGGSDAGGTGERRSAGGDAGLREAADIGVDRVFTPGRRNSRKGPDAIADDEDPDLDFVDAAEAGDPLDDEDSDALDSDALDDDERVLARLSPHPVAATTPPIPGQRPNPEPDRPLQPGQLPEEDPPTHEEDHEPGRT